MASVLDADNRSLTNDSGAGTHLVDNMAILRTGRPGTQGKSGLRVFGHAFAAI